MADRLSLDQDSATAETSSYRSVLKATTLIGGSSFIAILAGMIRTKLVAVLLGPDGVGFLGILTGLTSIVGTVTEMGLRSSGVRRIAEASGKNDMQTVSETVLAVRRTAAFTGVAGLMIMALGSPWWSKVSFGHDSAGIPIIMMGLSILFYALSTGHFCILQGGRRIADIAKISIFGSLCGVIISVPCYWFLGREGIALSILFGAVVTLGTSWWFSRRILLVPVSRNWHAYPSAAAGLLRFGVPVMLSSLVASICAYLIQTCLSRTAGLEAVGYYHAASNLTRTLVNFILGAMGTDYYPKLTAVAGDNEKIAREVNIQTETSILLAVPAIAVTIMFIPLAISFFYSGRFDPTVLILRWAIFGAFGRVVSWPLSFIILAKGRGALYLLSEFVFRIVQLVTFWIGFSLWGLPGTGIGYAVSHMINMVFMLILCRSLAGVTLKRSVSFQICGSLLALIVLSLLSASEMDPVLRWLIGSLIVILITLKNLRRVSLLTGLGLRDLKARMVGNKM